MKVMTTWSVMPGNFHEGVRRFLAGEAAPGEGVSLLGRWFSTDLSHGFSLYEAKDPAALFASAARWADIMEMETVLVIEDAEAGPALAALKK